MANRRKRAIDSSTSIPLTRVARPEDISSYVKKVINASLYDFYESEAFEVTEVILNDAVNHGAVIGTFIDNPNQPVLGDVVLPLMPNVTNIPVVGEHVVVVEYNGQHYYTSIINRRNSPNENSIPGTGGSYKKNTKYGDTFKRKDIRKVEVNEGDIVYEGRFGNSIKLGSDPTNNSPVIKIRAGQTLDNDTFGKPVKENIDEDSSSIYLISDGLKGESFDERKIEGEKILIKSDGIFIKGSDIRLGSVIEGNLQPVAKGNDLVEILDKIMDLFSTLFLTAPLTGTPLKSTNPLLDTKLKTLKPKIKNILSDKVKTT